MVLLEHLWTLAIEEHFYLLWPTLLALSLATARRYRVVAACAAGMLVLVLALPWPTAIAPVKDSYVRGAPILFGCVLAFVLRSSRARTLLRRARACSRGFGGSSHRPRLRRPLGTACRCPSRPRQPARMGRGRSDHRRRRLPRATSASAGWPYLRGSRGAADARTGSISSTSRCCP